MEKDHKKIELQVVQDPGLQLVLVLCDGTSFMFRRALDGTIEYLQRCGHPVSDELFQRIRHLAQQTLVQMERERLQPHLDFAS